MTRTPTYHPESGIDEELFLDVLTQITLHPETHNQQVYGVEVDCGTAYCTAGWTLVLRGRAEEMAWSQFPGQRQRIVTGINDDDAVLAGMSGYVLERAAADELGIEHDVAGPELFDANLTLDDLWTAAAELTDGRVSRAAMPVSA